ncbi:hypothetical protein ACVWYN_002958 [Pedobacter sp. UYP24]
MRIITLLILALLFSCSLKAQKNSSKRADSIDQRPALVLNGKRVDALSLFLLNKADFQSMVSLSPIRATKRYGEAGKYGAIVINLIKDRKVYNWLEIIQIFSFKPSLASLKCMLKLDDLGWALMPAADAMMIVSSEYKLNNLEVTKANKGEPMVVTFDRGYDDFRAPKVNTPFDQQMDSVTRIFKFEAAQRSSGRAY